jgi:hypothetical protein
MNNDDIADLDRRVDLKRTPVIIGDRLPYRFTEGTEDIGELIPFFRQALVPEELAGKGAVVERLTVIAYQDRLVVNGEVRPEPAKADVGLSRLYVVGPKSRLMVLLRREWMEESAPVRTASAVSEPAPSPVSRPAQEAAAVEGEANPEERQLASLVESWRRAWQGKRLEAYIDCYHPGFVNKGRSLSQWKAYKAALNRKYRSISVTVSGLRILSDGDAAKAYFRQQYRSDRFDADSYKILQFRKTGGHWKIFREDAYPSKPQSWPG